MNKMNARALEAEIRKGSFQPNMVLSNMGLAYFQDDRNFAARQMFPLCPVQLSTSYYYKFGKGDLMRDNVQPKPQYGKVNPAVFSHDILLLVWRCLWATILPMHSSRALRAAW